MSQPLDRIKAALAGRYDVEREVGSGGMATVYVAEDLRHRRKVAVKVLRPDLAATLGPERFQREIEIAARLQHPNILPLLDSGEADGFLYYVMPYIDGPSVREKLAREGALPIGEAVRILRDVVDALTEAHAHSVVHRDIKPENILLHGRHALVTDFGVAKAVSDATGLQKLTTAGVALGTPSYMAPEQAAADPLLDRRVDIYAIGAVAYEMLTGRPVFMGTTAQQILAAHMTEPPDPVSKHRDTVPAALEALVMRCLEKKPADRWQSADDLLPQLEALATPSGGVTPTDTRPMVMPRSRGWRSWWPVVVVGAAAVAVALLARRGPPEAVVLGHAIQVTADDGLEVHPAISPDGNLVAYAAGPPTGLRIFVRPVGEGRAIPLTEGTAGAESFPRWSPDGTRILFISDGNVQVVPALGGAVRTVVRSTPTAGGLRSADWSPDAREAAVVRGDSLYGVQLEGGAIRLILTDAGQLHSCAWSPTGAAIACVAGNESYVQASGTFGNLAPSSIVVVPLDGSGAVAVTDAAAINQSPAWSPDGRYLYYVSSMHGPRDIYRVRVSERGEPRGEPQRLTVGLDAQSVSLSADGARVAYSVYTSRSNLWTLPIPVRPPVNIAGATAVTSGSQVVESMRVSSDGEWLLYDSNLRGNGDIYRIRIGGGTPEQLTREPFDEFAADLSPDGSAVTYMSWETGSRDIVVRPLDGGAPQLLTNTASQESYPAWSPDGARIAFYDQAGNSGTYLLVRDSTGAWSDARLLGENMNRPAWSPDGRRLAVFTFMPSRDPAGAPREFGDVASPTRTSRWALVVVDPDDGSRRVAYEPDVGSGDPVPELHHWSPDGATLYFKSHDAAGRAMLWSVPASGGRPRLLVRFDDATRQSTRRDFAVDATHFYFSIEDRQSDIWVTDVEEGR